MRKIAIAFLTKDRVELTKRSIEPVLKAPVDVHIFDGSTTDEGKQLPNKYQTNFRYFNVGGGPDAAVAFALTTLLDHPENYTHIGLCENDVLLPPDWFDQTFALFDNPVFGTGAVGSVSARSYVDRVLFQCDGYAAMHNLGFGTQILTRQAAQIFLNNMRTTFTTENRRVFAKLAYIDIAKWWAFKTGEHWLVADWGCEKILASHGLISLALTPSPCQMIGQEPPLAYQGLQIVEQPVELLRNDKQFDMYLDNLARIRCGEWSPNETLHGEFRDNGNGSYIYFAHQLLSLGGKYSGAWKLRWQQGFGPFTWQASDDLPALSIPLIGAVDFLVSGGETGGIVRVIDQASGYETKVEVPPESKMATLTSIKMPASITYRYLSVAFLSPGLTLCGIKTREPQPWNTGIKFTHATLPPVS